MTKKDLKSGMIVKTSSGDEYMVFKDYWSTFYEGEDVLVNVNGRSWRHLNDYNEDLTYKSSYFDADIIEVYTPCAVVESIVYCVAPKRCTLILRWKREEPKEHTLAEIEKLLGYPVKIVEE